MAVQPHDDLALGGLYPSVHRFGHAYARMRQASQRQVGVAPPITTDNVQRPVGRASIDNDDLENRRLLQPEGVEQCGNPRRFVPAGNDNGHAFV